MSGIGHDGYWIVQGELLLYLLGRIRDKEALSKTQDNLGKMSSFLGIFLLEVIEEETTYWESSCKEQDCLLYLCCCSGHWVQVSIKHLLMNCTASKNTCRYFAVVVGLDGPFFQVRPKTTPKLKLKWNTKTTTKIKLLFKVVLMFIL